MIALPTIKDHLRIAHNLEDALLVDYEAAAVSYLQERAGEYWGPVRTVRVTHRAALTRDGLRIWLTGHVSYVVSVTGADGTALDEDYGFDVDGRTIALVGSTGGTFTVEYEQGFDDDDDVPERYRQAVLMLVAHWYANRTPVAVATVAVELPFGIAALIPQVPVIG
jgi:uncharacterized phiE125 gp8 family phage protein